MKKGYFYTTDVMFALVALAIGFLLIWGIFVVERTESQSYFLSNDMMDFLLGRQNKELSSPYIQELIVNGTIDREKYILDQTGILYYNQEFDLARRYIEDATLGVVPQQYGFELSIDGFAIYNNSAFAVSTLSTKEDAKILVSTKRIFFFELPNNEISKPQLAEVSVWR